MFDSLPVKDSRPMAFLRKAVLIFLGLFLIIGIMSSHRAYYQVRSLELHAEGILHSGSTIQTTVASSGRTYVDVQLELRQGTHSETLAMQRAPGNEYGFFDPRTQRASLEVTLTPEILSRFEAGRAQLRATAYGHSQWTRVPPPVVRELDVEIERE
ncbi:MAG: hypothetical protein H7Y30_16435 [Pyrinomonadaceae bacterium]|nr:hypothetical protein [Pyrinomonadaceae bacterium]